VLYVVVGCSNLPPFTIPKSKFQNSNFKIWNL